MRVLVTGGSGFVGRQAVATLLARGVEVHAVGRTPAPIDCVWHSADLLDAGQTRALVRAVRPDAVLHLAWCVEHGRFWTDPANAEWVKATLTLAKAAAEAGATRFAATGTCYEYDWPTNADCHERDTPRTGHTPYDIAKSQCREALTTLFADQGVSFAWAPLFFLYGPNEDPRRLIASVARALARGEAAACSTGKPVRDFMDVRDAGAALAALVLSPVEGVVNVATGQGARIAEVASMLGRLAGRPELIQLGALPDREGEPPRIVADIARLRDEVGFRPQFDLKAGLADALRYWAAREGVSLILNPEA